MAHRHRPHRLLCMMPLAEVPALVFPELALVLTTMWALVLAAVSPLAWDSDSALVWASESVLALALVSGWVALKLALMLALESAPEYLPD